MISEFPLFIFTTLTGLAAGTYIAAAFFPRKAGATEPVKYDSGNEKSEAKVVSTQEAEQIDNTKENTSFSFRVERSWLFPLTIIILLAIGSLGALFHLQHPERVLNALSNPAAGITQEAYWSMLLGVIAVIELVLVIARRNVPRWLRYIGAAIGFVLACITGYAYFISYGVPGWTSPATIGLFVFGDIAIGLAFWALLSKREYDRSYGLAVIVVQVLLALTFVVECVVLSGSAVSLVLLIVGLIVSCGGSLICLALSNKGKLPSANVLIFIFTIVGVCLARYAFYAACPF